MKSEKIFFIAGAQRCGTSFMVHTMDEHPQIQMAKPVFPEPKFFMNGEEYLKGKGYYLNKYFKDRSGEFLLGEKSTSYIESKQAAYNIKQMFPDAKIIVSLRNPVERAISNYYFSRANKIEVRTPREVFLENKMVAYDKNKFSVSPFDYLARGEYLKYIKDYMGIFGREKIHIVLFEKIAVQDTWNKIWNFLEVDSLDKISVEKINEGLDKVEIENEVKEFLQNYYNHHNKELEDYLKTDLSLWNY